MVAPQSQTSMGILDGDVPLCAAALQVGTATGIGA